MLRQPNYIYGPNTTLVPATINFGEYMLQQLWKHKDNTALVAQLTVVPPILVALCKDQTKKYDLSSVLFILSGAAPLRKDIIAAAHVKFPNLVMVMQGYGATELTLGVLGFFPDSFRVDKIGSVGVVVPNVVLKVTRL
ncbi:hypothetical protein SFRURICE_019865 [Spodoptera frugiperda]|nr:hypothetical protein SFRURICE_019865 [Spodoptera frugiperda]